MNEQNHTAAPVRVHRTAPKITKRIREILDEPNFPVERTYQWAAANKFRHYYIGPNLCCRDDFLVEDLTSGTGRKKVARTDDQQRRIMRRYRSRFSR